jgi:hypothetical protein
MLKRLARTLRIIAHRLDPSGLDVELLRQSWIPPLEVYPSHELIEELTRRTGSQDGGEAIVRVQPEADILVVVAGVVERSGRFRLRCWIKCPIDMIGSVHAVIRKTIDKQIAGH